MELKEFFFWKGCDNGLRNLKGVDVILRREGHKFVRSEKLVGQREGQRLYRSTFLLRLEKPEDEKKEQAEEEEKTDATEDE